MNKDTIEKAAIEFAQSHYLDKYGNLPEDIPHKVFEDLVASIAYMFMYGAHWRINAVWHDCQKELPKREGEQILLEAVLDGKTVYIPVMWVNDGKGATESMTRWAYISDLIPDIN